MAKIDPCLTSKTNEHYTPLEFLAHVYAFLGTVNLDPCSSTLNNPTVFADCHYTKEMDGLALPWFGKVFCNPPYGNGLLQWSEKIKTEYESGNVSEALFLVPSRTDTKWTRSLESYSRVYLYQRIKFADINRIPQDSAPFPSVVFYFGNRQKWFERYWNELGDVRICAKKVGFNKTAYQREYMRKRRANPRPIST
jgi:hypothetical protein